MRHKGPLTKEGLRGDVRGWASGLTGREEVSPEAAHYLHQERWVIRTVAAAGDDFSSLQVLNAHVPDPVLSSVSVLSVLNLTMKEKTSPERLNELPKAT